METSTRHFWTSLLVCGFVFVGTWSGTAADATHVPASGGDPSVRAVAPFSAEAYRAEFRHLRSVYRKIDLNGPAIPTDGWTTNIPEAEWPFMGICYFSYACANLAENDPLIRAEALAEMRWIIHALQTPRLTGFIESHFGKPFGEGNLTPSTFVHGHFLQTALRYREVSGDMQFDALIHRIAKAFANAYSNSDQAILPSYTGMWWLSDNFVSLSALARYDDAFETRHAEVARRLIETTRRYYLDPQLDLVSTYVVPASKHVLQGPRGVSTMYGLQFLSDFAPDFAESQYAKAKRIFVRSAFGFSAVREFPAGRAPLADVDSGPLVLGLGPSASGFAIAAAAVMGDTQTAQELIDATLLVGLPEFKDGKLHYMTMPTVGQAVILFGKTQLQASEAQLAEKVN